jgi:hypothetical protein
MLVVLAIIVVITAVALLGQSTFNNSLLLTDTAYTVAFSMRDAQTRGLSSRTYDPTGSPVTNTGYGVYFSTANPLNLNSYYLFADIVNTATPPAACTIGAAGTPEWKPGNCLYDTGASPDGVVQTLRFNRGFTIGCFCGNATSAGNPSRCSNTGTVGVDRLERLNIVFLRPNTDTVITGVTSSGTPIPLINAKIYIRSPQGVNRSVCVSQVGQVYVATTTCPGDIPAGTCP